MKRLPIAGSSFATSAGFEPIKGQLTGVLEVEKANGSVLRFSNVTMEEWVELMSARTLSFGKGMQKFLRTKNEDGTPMYPCMSQPATKPKDLPDERMEDYLEQSQ